MNHLRDKRVTYSKGGMAIGANDIRRIPALPVAIAAICLAVSTGVWSMQERRVLSSTNDVNVGLPGPPGDAPAVAAGGFVYTSGLFGLDHTGRSDQPDVTAETRRVLDRLKAVLEAGGSSLSQAVSVTVDASDVKPY